jgi:hypothetical protein
MCTISLLQSSKATLSPKASLRTADQKDVEEKQRSSYLPASDILTATTTGIETSADQDNFLSTYESSPNRWRWFCGRCGTNIAYTIVMPAGISKSLMDITLGSVDREYLEKEALVPERHLWWDYGVDWIRKLGTEGYGELPIHADYRVGETVTVGKKQGVGHL